MEILKNAGEFKVLATWPSIETNSNAQMVLERAGRTCYQSEKGDITPESAAKFIGGIMKRGHYSVIEHGWRGYIIDQGCLRDMGYEDLLRWVWPEVKFMSVTWREREMLISGNLETWRKLYVSGKLNSLYGILYDLEQLAPSVFNKGLSKNLDADRHYGPDTPIDTTELLKGPEEMLAHVAHTVQYNGHSRGFTHELVRHRIPVFSQESTRYVDESNFEMVIPPGMDEEAIQMSLDYGSDGYMWHGTVGDWLGMNENAYVNLREKGWKPEDARQLLPTAIKAQIVMSCNLLERRYIYFRRCHRAAHWEIRRTMCDELKYMQSMYPGLFSDFIYNEEAKAFDVPDCTSYFYEGKQA